MDETKEWEVEFTGIARKQRKLLPGKIREVLDLLVADLEKRGPEVQGWPHFGLLKGRTITDSVYHHCHLNKGKPCYVAVWRSSVSGIKLVEVRYVGTHENADYKRIR